MENKQIKYQDLIERKHPVSKIHSQMSMHDRAAQFAPFAALTGHNDAIKETARLTKRRIELSEEEKEQLDMKLSQLLRDSQKRKPISVTYFEEDLHKEGGTYITVTGTVKKIDEVGRRLVMEDNRKIIFQDIYALNILEL